MWVAELSKYASISYFSSFSRHVKKGFLQMCITICGKPLPDKGAAAFNSELSGLLCQSGACQIAEMIFQTGSGTSCSAKNIFKQTQRIHQNRQHGHTSLSHLMRFFFPGSPGFPLASMASLHFFLLKTAFGPIKIPTDYGELYLDFPGLFHMGKLIRNRTTSSPFWKTESLLSVHFHFHFRDQHTPRP